MFEPAASLGRPRWQSSVTVGELNLHPEAAP